MAKKNTSKNKSPKRALCVGINDYPYEGNDLNGCVNDANGWACMLKTGFGFAGADVKLLTDSEGTKKNVLNALKDLLAGAKSGDVLVYTNSSHGSYLADTNGDEERYDEIICPYDIYDNHIIDDELRNLFDNLPNGVNLTVILDNCFSGTATRALVKKLLPGGTDHDDDRRIRFLSPALRGLPILKDPWTAKPKGKANYTESKMKDVLLTGCTDKEYSYDAYFGGKYHGAMTYFALKAVREANYKLTYAQLHGRITGTIKAYPQHPQLEGKNENKKKQIFS